MTSLKDASQVRRLLLFGSAGGALSTFPLGLLTANTWIFILTGLCTGALIGLAGRVVAKWLKKSSFGELISALLVGMLLGSAGIGLGSLHGSIAAMLLSLGAGGVIGLAAWQSASPQHSPATNSHS